MPRNPYVFSVGDELAVVEGRPKVLRVGGADTSHLWVPEQYLRPIFGGLWREARDQSADIIRKMMIKKKVK